MKRLSFDTESILAIQAGRKSETTRVVKPQPWKTEWTVWPFDKQVWDWDWPKNSDCRAYGVRCTVYGMSDLLPHFARYHVGDLVAVTEWWSPYAANVAGGIAKLLLTHGNGFAGPVLYATDFEAGCRSLDVGGGERWLPPFLMKAEHSRTTIEILTSAACRVQDLTYEQILAECWDPRASEPVTQGTAGEDARAWWQRRWDALNPKYPYASNPWAMRYGFREVK